MNNTKSKRTKVKALLFALMFAVMSIMTVALSACGGNSPIKFAETEKTMYVSDSARLNYSLADEKADITWSSSNETVATVRRGTVTAKAVGETTITASVEGGSATCKITVLDRTITLSQNTATIDLDSDVNSVTLTATASDGGSVTWATSDSSLATVNGGVVTATGEDIGNVIITASRGAAVAECVVTIIKPSRPEDFYRVTMMNTPDTINDAGKWHYHADGSANSDYTFVKSPYHQNNSVSTTLSNLNLNSGKYFYFRYQPTYEVDTTYTLTFSATLSNDGIIRYTNGSADKLASLKAGETKTFVYVAKVKDNHAFSVRIENCDSLVNAQETTFTLSGISFEEGDHAPAGSNDPHRSELADVPQYNLTMSTNASIVLDRGAWYYSCDGIPNTDFAFAETPKYDNGTVTMSFSHINNFASAPTHQLRYQPDFAVGTYYKLTATITLSAAGTINYGTEYSGVKNYPALEFEAGQTQAIEFVEMVNSERPFNIGIKPADATQPIAITVTAISVVETEKPTTPPENPGDTSYELVKKTNSEVVAAPGVWAYTSPETENFVAAPDYKNGVVTMDISSRVRGDVYQLRYQPDFATGTEYTAVFTVKLDTEDETAYFVFGNDFKNSNTWGDKVVNEDGSITITYPGTVGANPFMIQPNTTSEETAVAVKMTVKDIKFTAKQQPVDPEPGNGYDLPNRNSADTKANPGEWSYWADQGSETASAPRFEDDTVTFALKTITANSNCVIRYQPDFAEGTEYTVTLTVKIETDKIRLNAEDTGAYILFGNDFKSSTDLTPVDGNTYNITWKGVIANDKGPFAIQVKTKEYDAPVTIVVSNITFVAAQAA